MTNTIARSLRLYLPAIVLLAAMVACNIVPGNPPTPFPGVTPGVSSQAGGANPAAVDTQAAPPNQAAPTDQAAPATEGGVVTQVAPGEPAAATTAPAAPTVQAGEVTLAPNELGGDNSDSGGGGPESGSGQAPTAGPGTANPDATTPGGQLFLPQVGGAAAGSSSPAQPRLLAYLSGGNFWLVQAPGGTPAALTQGGNLMSFAWAPDGQRVATFDGRSLCIVPIDGSQAPPCLDTGTSGSQSATLRRLAWSPDQKTIVVWNPTNPGDAGEVGWIIVPLNGTDPILRISDPVQFGAPLTADNQPGGITGQPIFLADGSLIGTLTHRTACSASGCTYALFRFKLPSQGEQPAFAPVPEGARGQPTAGRNLLLASKGRSLVDFGTAQVGCASSAEALNLDNGEKRSFSFDQETLEALGLSPDGSQAIIARLSTCDTQQANTWAKACGLTSGPDAQSMQLWDLASNQRAQLIPGLDPAWSPDGTQVAFRSCLAESSGTWGPTPSGPPSIFIMAPNGDGLTQVAEGSDPAWKP